MFELRLLCPEDVVEMVSDAVIELDALSVSVEDADANTDAERAIFGEPNMPVEHTAWVRSRIVALFSHEREAREAASILALQDFFQDSRVVDISVVADQDWVRITQSQFEPVPVTEDFFIVPTWCETPPRAKQVIRLDPGLAFGTGTHPTTRMCLKWIATQGAQSPLGRTLDYGCGSGILAIAAKKYGASSVDAVDIDVAAATSSEENAKANQVVLNIGLPNLASGRYETVVANILASPLKVLAPLLTAHVEMNGRLILAGILERQADELKEAYSPYVALDVADTMDGWILMTAQKISI